MADEQEKISKGNLRHFLVGNDVNDVPSPEVESEVVEEIAQPVEGKKTSPPKIGLFIMGALLIGSSYISFPGNEASSTTGGDSESDERTLLEKLEDGTPAENGAYAKYPNPQLTLYERLFCRGNNQSDSCNRKRHYHPFVEVIESHDLTYEQALLLQGGDLPKEQRRPTATVRQSRAFSSLLD